MALFVRDGGVWKESSAGGLSVKDSNIWKQVQNGFVKDGGVWKQFYQNIVSFIATTSSRSNFDTRGTVNPLNNSTVVVQPFTLGGAGSFGNSTIFSVSDAGLNQWGYYFLQGSLLGKILCEVAIDPSGNTYACLISETHNLNVKINSSGTIVQRNMFLIGGSPITPRTISYNSTTNNLVFFAPNSTFVRFDSNLNYIDTKTGLPTGGFPITLLSSSTGQYVLAGQETNNERLRLTFLTDLSNGTKTISDYQDVNRATPNHIRPSFISSSIGPSNEIGICGGATRYQNGNALRSELFVAKFNSSGTPLWAFTAPNFLGGTQNIFFNSVDIDANGDFYCCGEINGIDGGNFDYRAIVCKFNSSGGLIYAYTIKGPSLNTARESRAELKPNGTYQIYPAGDSTQYVIQVKADGSIAGTSTNGFIFTSASPSFSSFSLSRTDSTFTLSSSSNYSSVTDNFTATSFTGISSTVNI